MENGRRPRARFLTVVHITILLSACASETIPITDGGPADQTSADRGRSEQGIDAETTSTLTLNKTGVGRVTSQPAGLTCGDGCSTAVAPFAARSQVKLTAEAGCGWTFDGWSGDCSGTAPEATVELTGDRRCAALFKASTSTTETLSSGDLTATLATDGSHGAVLQQVTWKTGVFAVAAGPLWRMELWNSLDRTQSEQVIPGSAAFSCYRTADGTAVEITWRDVSASSGDKFDVEVNLRALPTEGLLRFGGAVRYQGGSGPGTHGVGRLYLPLLDLVDQGPASELYLGAGGGMVFRNPAQTIVSGDPAQPAAAELTYPYFQTLRVNAYANPTQKAVLLLSIDEPAAERFRLKQFVGGATAAGAVRLALGHKPDDPFSSHDVTFEGEAVLGVRDCAHEGACWHAVASWYREKVSKEGWLTRGKMVSAAQPTRDTLDYDLLVLVGEADPIPAVPDYSAYIKYLDGTRADFSTATETIAAKDTVSIWYDWHDNPFDVNLPEHLPPRGDFKQYVNQAVSAGYDVTPYTNTNGWHTDVPSYSALNVEPHVLVGRDGSRAKHGDPAKQQQYAATDPATAFVQTHFTTQLFQPLIQTHGLTGIYMDAFPGARECYADSHGHPVGGGDSYVQGVLRWLDATAQIIEAKRGAGRSLILNEGMAEYLINHAAGANWYRGINFYGVSSPRSGYIPLFEAVYHEYIPIVSIGASDMPGWSDLMLAKDAAEQNNLLPLTVIKDSFFLDNGWQFAAGHNLALVRRPVVDAERNVTLLKNDPRFADLMAFHRDVVRLRKVPALKEFLLFGRIATPPTVLTGSTSIKQPVVRAALVPHDRDAVPAAFTYAFQNTKGDVAVTLVNWTDKTIKHRIALHPKDYDIAYSEVGGKVTFPDSWEVVLYRPGQAPTLVGTLNQSPELLIPPVDAALNAWKRTPMVLVYRKK